MIDLLKKWLNGTARAKDERALEREAFADDFLADAVEGYQSMPGSDHTKNIDALKAQLPHNKKRKDRAVIWWRVAAAAALIGVISTWVFINQNPETLDIAANETAVEEVQESEDIQKEESINQTAPPVEPAPEETLGASELPVSEKQRGPAISTPQASGTSELKIDQEEEENLIVADEIEEFESEAPIVLAKPLDSASSKLSVRELANTNSTSPNLLDSSRLSNEEAGEADVVVEGVQIQVDKELQDRPRVLAEPAPAKAKRKLNRGTKKRELAGSSVSKDESQILVLRGTVLDSESDDPLIGANVIIKGSNQGVITDFDGRFELASSQPLPLVLELSYLGYDTQEVIVENAEEDFELRMEEGEAVLEEVVITSYSGKAAKAESDPRPKGGWEKFNRYISENLKYPESAVDQQLEGNVKLEFYINKKGRPEQFEILQSLCEPCDQEAIRLLEEGPKWRGKEQQTSVTIKFKL